MENVPPVIAKHGTRKRYAVGGDLYRFIATREHTQGRFTIYETVTPPGHGAMTHIHSKETESFLILEGQLVVQSNDVAYDLAPGDFITFPKGCSYSFRNEASESVRFVTFLNPGGLEDFLEIVGQPIGADATSHEPTIESINHMVALGKEFGVEYFPA
jgi:mannose-6-phosphate isomerase-like protein (cupin superfamily)